MVLFRESNNEEVPYLQGTLRSEHRECNSAIGESYDLLRASFLISCNVD